jgi:hypothetical protein
MLGSSDPIPADRELLERVEVADTVLWRRLSEPSPNRPKTPPRTVIPLGGKMRSPLGEPASPSAVDRIESAGATREQPTNDLEAGLLALESGSTGAAIESLRRATFRDASSALAQFALARAYVAIGDRGRALTALLHTRRLLAPLSSNEFVPGIDSLSAEALRQTVQTFLEDLTA